MEPINDFPKIECPFIRKTYKVDHDDFKRHGSRLGMRSPEVYLVTPEINSGFEWVLQHESTSAIEKLDGSNVGLVTENGRLIHVQNRMNIIDPLQVMSGKTFLIEGIFNAIEKNYILKSGVQYGECLGPKLQCNKYKLPSHLWYPFTKARESLRYNSFNKYEKSFWSWSEWFRLYLKSLFYCRNNRIPLSDMFTNPDVPFAEGVVFYNDDCKPTMSKLRRDMWFWHYSDKIKIFDLDDETVRYAKEKGIAIKGYD